MKKLFKISGKVLIWAILIVVLLLFIVKLGGWMDERKSDEALRAKFSRDDLNVRFYTNNSSDPSSSSLSYMSVVRENLTEDPSLAILFVHGSPGSLDAYLSYLQDDRLLSRAALYSVDRPGFGKSQFGTAQPSLEQQAAQIKKVIDAIPEKNILLVGHSFGCAVIARIAMDYPTSIDGMMMIAGTMAGEAEPPNWWRKVVDFPLMRWFIPNAFIVCNREMLPLRQELNEMTPHWSKVQVPTTVIHGTADWIVSYDNLPIIANRLEHLEKKRIVSLKGQGHLILWTDKERMISEILETIHLMEIYEVGAG